MSDFFRIGTSSQHPYGSQPPNDPNYSPMYHGVQLTPLPAVYRQDRRIRAADTDAHGRRLGAVGEDWDGKDTLPAYDNFDRPPKYIESSWSHGHLMEQSAVIPSLEGEQSGITHSNTTDRAPRYDTHAVAGPATHHNLSSS